jgi:hypothetical protein
VRIISILSTLKGKALAAILVSLFVAGGSVAVMAAPMGQNAIHPTSNTAKAAATAHPTEPRQEDKGANDDGAGKNDKDTTNNQATGCPALPAVQQLATEFGLSTAATSNAIKTICALHDGAFKGTTSAGAAVSSSRVFGLGEIEALLALSKFTAAHSGTTMTDANVQTLLANVLQQCGSKSMIDCVKDVIPNFHPTNGNGDGDHGNHGKY